MSNNATAYIHLAQAANCI